MSKGLSTRWTQHLRTAEERKDFGDLVRNSTQALGRLQTMIKEGAEGEDRSLITNAALENPNWSNKVAFNMGKRAGEQRILELLSFLDP